MGSRSAGCCAAYAGEACTPTSVQWPSSAAYLRPDGSLAAAWRHAAAAGAGGHVPHLVRGGGEGRGTIRDAGQCDHGRAGRVLQRRAGAERMARILAGAGRLPGLRGPGRIQREGGADGQRDLSRATRSMPVALGARDPVVPQALNILEHFDLASMGHNSAASPAPDHRGAEGCLCRPPRILRRSGFRRRTDGRAAGQGLRRKQWAGADRPGPGLA